MSTVTLKAAFAKVNELPEADQNRIGRGLTRYVDDLQRLRGAKHFDSNAADAPARLRPPMSPSVYILTHAGTKLA